MAVGRWSPRVEPATAAPDWTFVHGTSRRATSQWRMTLPPTDEVLRMVDDTRSPDDEKGDAGRPPFQDKKEGSATPDRPTSSDDATMVERQEGAHAEFADTPDSMEDADARDRSRQSGDDQGK